METIFTENYLLESKSAQHLYHFYAKDLPIIDYHNHLSPKDIAENIKFKNLTEAWLGIGDHYKWRAMRTLGISEDYITGNQPDEEKFLAWAKCVPYTVRNPLFAWTHLELKNPFGIHEYLNEKTALSIYERANEKLQEDQFSTRGILENYHVKMACTTDDPIDDLQYHQKISKEGFTIKILPGFRPDKIFNIENKDAFISYLQQLELKSGVKISDFNTLLEALKQRVDYFHEAGCRIADHGIPSMPPVRAFKKSLEQEFKYFIQDKNIESFSHPEAFKGQILLELCKLYHQKGWVQQFHIGPMRNNNQRLFYKLGADAGFDSIGDELQAVKLSAFLNELDLTEQLTKTIIYNLNPSYNEVFAAMTGNFNDGNIRGKVQFGAAWWFMDTMDGMTRQLNALSNIGVISTFVGMLTDSRSFLSFPRHEYFRRLLCNMFGNEMEKGLLPKDEKWIGEIIKNICYDNAKSYFNY
ncbi:glucuronate isomerase [Cloacibacterium sp. TD35]|uniref:glucuronate isomerase n=1 Tax=Cloacibacterium sp. TD35 TaxID=2976818 RepID=UPI00237E5CC1|nr:glucuronate isomerase [Cloacibacterium sp. TD35]WDT67872.1 glucuronate isomerase [Cloacibacterium sp. TD35]